MTHKTVLAETFSFESPTLIIDKSSPTWLAAFPETRGQGLTDSLDSGEWLSAYQSGQIDPITGEIVTKITRPDLVSDLVLG